MVNQTNEIQNYHQELRIPTILAVVGMIVIFARDFVPNNLFIWYGCWVAGFALIITSLIISYPIQKKYGQLKRVTTQFLLIMAILLTVLVIQWINR